MVGWLSFTICLGLIFWLIQRFFIVDNLSNKQLITGFGIKLVFAIIYILLFTYYFSNARLNGDSARFFYDSGIINAVFYESPLDFSRLLLGLQPLQESSIELMQHTSIWSVGPSTDWINDNRLILKLNAIIHFISFGNIYVHVLIFAFLSFTGLFYTYKAFKEQVAHSTLFWWAIIAFPNLAFWGTGLLKESLFILNFGFWCWAIHQLVGGQIKLKYGVLMVLAGFFLLTNKPYAGFIIIGFSFAWLSGWVFHWQKKALIGLGLLSVLFTLSVFVLPGRLNLTDKISYKQTDLNNLGQGGIAFITDSSFCVFSYDYLHHFEVVNNDSILVKKETEGEYKLFGKTVFKSFRIPVSEQHYAVYLIYAPSTSYHEPVLIDHSSLQLLKNTGMALVNVFVRPTPLDNGDPLKYVSFASNLILLCFFIYSLFKRRTLSTKQWYLVFNLFCAALLIALIIGWSVPIFGAIVRYKIPSELLLIIIGFMLLKPTDYVKS